MRNTNYNLFIFLEFQHYSKYKQLGASLDVIREQADKMISGIEVKMAQIMELRVEQAAMEDQKIQVQSIRIAM